MFTEFLHSPHGFGIEPGPASDIIGYIIVHIQELPVRQQRVVVMLQVEEQ